jgi:alkanesulfonate monooxygenase SsuD/methylene tetrahydromethanopterin reductase-like flavin-dependent oxidoreductase (luciferase family)
MTTMQVYAFDLMPWPHLDEASYYPDLNRLYDPVRGRLVYELDFDLCQTEGLSIIGDPDYVTREIQAQMRELGAGVFMGLFPFGSMPHALARKNIRMFGEKVLPALKRG